MIDPAGSKNFNNGGFNFGMRIAQVAPLYESVPPKYYGGTERVVSYLTEELFREGHDVTLFASGDSQTDALLRGPCDQALRLNRACKDPLPYHLVMLNQVARIADTFDIIHFHIDFLHFPVFRASLGQDVDDNAWPPRSARSAATISRISDDAARLDLECPTDAFAHGKLVRHRISWAAERSLCPGSRRWRLLCVHRPH